MPATTRVQDFYFASRGNEPEGTAEGGVQGRDEDVKKETSARQRGVSIPAVGEGKLATCAENFGVAVLLASMTLGPVLLVPTGAQLAASYHASSGGAWLQVGAFAACKAGHALAFASLLVSVDMAGRSLRHKLVCRA